jgi:hypothetical protein
MWLLPHRRAPVDCIRHNQRARRGHSVQIGLASDLKGSSHFSPVPYQSVHEKMLPASSKSFDSRAPLFCFAAFDPVIDIISLEFPQLADTVGGKAFSIDPPIDGVLGDAQVLGNFFSR